MRVKTQPSMRGRPLVMLLAMALCWTGMRFALWPAETVRAIERALPTALLAESYVPRKPALATSERASGASAGPRVAGPGRAIRALSAKRADPASQWRAVFGEAIERAAAHDLLWIAAVARGAYGYPAPAIASDMGGRASPTYKRGDVERRAAPPRDRWSFDSWLLWRPDGMGNAAAGPASYGGSQAGALLGYRLAPGSRLAPQAYARASGFPGGMADSELALGFGLRPIARLPIQAQVELRARGAGGQVSLRPAALVVGGASGNVGGLDADAYGQVGYVGGSDATAFADGKLTLRRLVAAGGGFRLAAGGGAWGGAQDGAARVDIGPSASLTMAKGPLTARVEADYRFRIAGDAKPDSGPALTVSASF